MRLSIICSVDVNLISWIHQHIDRLLNRLFRSARKTISKLHIIMLLWGQTTSGDYWPVVSLTNGPVMRKSVLCHDVITSFLVLLYFKLTLFDFRRGCTGEFPAQRPVTRSFDVFFDLHLNKRLSKQSWGWWFEMPSRSLGRHCNVDTEKSGSTVWLQMAFLRALKNCFDFFSTTPSKYKHIK